MKRLVYVLIFVIMISIVSAQDFSDPNMYDTDNPEYNKEIYDDPNAYLSSDFYTYSDPSQWNMNLVDYNNPAFYSNLPPEIYDKIDYAKVDYNNEDFYKNMPDNAYSKIDYNKVNYHSAYFYHDNVDQKNTSMIFNVLNVEYIFSMILILILI